VSLNDVDVISDCAAAWPEESTRYRTASPLNGGVNDQENDPAGTEPAGTTAPVEGLNHSTVNVRELDIAERLTVNEPPLGE
jgi:hypothetical protein